MGICEICRKNEVRVNLARSETNTLHICMECNNNLVAENIGMNLIPFRHGVYEFTGIDEKKHRFYIDRILNPVGVSFEANELIADGSVGYRVGVMDDVDCDQQILFEKLKSKLKKTLSKKYLQISAHPYAGEYIRLKEDEVIGRLEYDETQDQIPKVIIDGKEFSWEEFGRMLSSCEGFQFKLQIYDLKEDME
jgi:hypothetical protein